MGDNLSLSEKIPCSLGRSQGACIRPAATDLNAHCSNQAKDYDENGIDCGGAYCAPCSQLPGSVSDEELLTYISKWWRSEVANSTLLSVIGIWKNAARPE